MKGICFAPSYDAPGKRDTSTVFTPEAKRFVALHGGRVFRFNNSLVFRKRARQILEELAKETDLDYVAFACHGWEGPNAGIQAGFNLGNVAILARAIAAATHRSPYVPFYCCEVGSDNDRDDKDDNVPGWAGDGGFADRLRDELALAGDSPRVIAHTMTAHATFTPYVRVFDGNAPAAGGPWLIGPSEIYWRRWRLALRTGDLRLRIPFLSREAIISEITK